MESPGGAENGPPAVSWLRRRRRPLAVAVCLVALPAALAVGLRLYWGHRISAGLEALRRDGYPTSMAELAAWYVAVPEADNGASLYAAAFERLLADRYGEEETDLPDFVRSALADPGERIPDEALKSAQDILDRHAEAFDLIRRAADRPGCRFPVDLAGGPDAAGPRVKGLLWIANLLKLEAVARAETGDRDRSWEAVRRMFRVSSVLRGEPSIFSHLFGGACRDLAVDAAARVLSRIAPSVSELDALSSAVAATGEMDGLERAFAAELCWSNELFSTGRIWDEAVGGEEWSVRAYGWGLRHLGPGHGQHASFVDLYRELLACSRTPYPQRIEAVNQAVNRVPLYWVLTRLMAGPWQSVVRHDAASLARLRALEAAIGVERFRLARGALPGSLAELVPDHLSAAPRDPFDGLALRYGLLPGGFRVWSVGEDREDDGGKDGTKEDEGKDDDVPFSVFR